MFRSIKIFLFIAQVHGVLALPNCTYSLENNLALIAPTNPLSDDALICHQSGDYLTLETNMVTVRMGPGVSVSVRGQLLPHLVGNCDQAKLAPQQDLWLQMGAEHCIKLQREESKSWIKAEQFCQQDIDGGHLISLHNSLDEKLVQNLVFKR